MNEKFGRKIARKMALNSLPSHLWDGDNNKRAGGFSQNRAENPATDVRMKKQVNV
jgi:hypothetical protein